MVKEQNDCCGCAVPAYPCLGDSCPNKHALHYFCDKCEGEYQAEELYDVNGEMLCRDCLLEHFPRISV